MESVNNFFNEITLDMRINRLREESTIHVSHLTLWLPFADGYDLFSSFYYYFF
jgi:hypothetical protein